MSLSFFILGGGILVVSGLLQALVRPRDPKERGLARVVNRATIRALMFVSVGVLAILIGAGVIPLAALGIG